MSAAPFIRRSWRALSGAVALLLLSTAAPSCSCGDPPVPGGIAGDGFAAVTAIDARTVVLSFSRNLDANTVATGAFDLVNYTVAPPENIGIDDASATAPAEVTLTVAPLVGGTRYTLNVSGLKDDQGNAIEGTINFTALGQGGVVPVEVVIADVETAREHDQLVALVTVAESGLFSEQLVAYPFVEEGGRFVAHIDVASDDARTLDRGDDTDPAVDRRPFVVLVVDGVGRMASALVPFVVPTTAAPPLAVPVTVLPPLEIIDQPEQDPLPAPPVDDNPEDGLKVVRVVIDDRAAAELTAPQLKAAFNVAGAFDSSFPQTLTLTPMEGDDAGYWQVVVQIAVDPARTADGQTEPTFPYFVFLVEGGTNYEGISAGLLAADETPQTVRLSLGDPTYTPVTFRVDVSRAYLNPQGSARGVFPGESVFLTGEWQQAVDAFGNNCGDAFSGGEQRCLEMRELSSSPGVWTRTVWLPPGRPYGWKVVRCRAGEGCGALNQVVASAGRAFATVMKNLATDNADAFADPDVGIVDPISPAATVAGDQTLNYTSAQVYVGTGVGGEGDPTGTPDGARMFKQEVPDLVVVVGAQALKTRVVHVGTWRDVNLGSTPEELIAAQQTVELGPVDYDDGFIGRFPPSRESP